MLLPALLLMAMPRWGLAQSFVEVDTEAAQAYVRINSAFIDLDKDLYHPATAEVELGRQLFFDPRLSGNKAMSCASCHNPSLAWGDGLPRARGLDQKELDRNTPSLFNTARNIPHRYFWDGRADTLEEAAKTALRGRLEMNRDPRQLVVELNRIPGYVQKFVDLYGLSGITEENVIKAIAAFIKAEIHPGETPFDRFARDPRALSLSERNGLKLFTGKARCMICHTGTFFSDDFFHNTGLKPTPGIFDPGRYAVTREKRAWRAFRTPPLRNVALTGPYMHDGSIKTLREVVEFYDRGTDDPEARDEQIKPLGLTVREKEDLLAFLNALTSPQQPVSLPVLPPPGGSNSVEEITARNPERLKMIEFSLAHGDRGAIYANATALRENAESMRPLLEPSEPQCLADLQSRAWDLASLAESTATPKELRKSFESLRYNSSRCVPPFPSEGVPQALPAAACLPHFSVASFLGELERRNVEEAKMTRIKELTIRDALAYVQYKTLTTGDISACDEIKGLVKTYAGISIPAEKACRERFYEDMVAHDLITQSPHFMEHCRQSLIHSYDYLQMDDKNATAACEILGKNADDPKAACAQLVPRYLAGLKEDSCVNLLLRLKPRQDKAVCDNLDGAPTDWKARCLALNGFNQAFWKKDASLCEDRELCWALMGAADKSVDKCAQRIKATVCSLLTKTY